MRKDRGNTLCSAANVAANAVVVAHHCAGIAPRVDGGDAATVRVATATATEAAIGEDHLTTAILTLMAFVGRNVLSPLGILVQCPVAHIVLFRGAGVCATLRLGLGCGAATT